MSNLHDHKYVTVRNLGNNRLLQKCSVTWCGKERVVIAMEKKMKYPDKMIRSNDVMTK